MKSLSLVFALAILLAHRSSPAAGPRRIQIKSAFDNFELVVTSPATGAVDGKPSDLKPLTDLWPVFNGPLEADCPPLKGQADAVFTENGKSRSLYVKQKIVTDGKKCLNVGGDGLFFFPVHRDFIIGKPRDSIRLNSPLKIFRQGVKIVDLHKTGDRWVNDNSDQLLNWNFLEQFENSLRNFDVRWRVQAAIAEGRPKMIVQSDGQAYEFYKISQVMWAVKKPGYAWLEASADWSFWYEFDSSLLEDRWAPQIRALSDPKSTTARRAEVLNNLYDVWSPNLREVYHKMLMEPRESVENKTAVLNHLKHHPSLETAVVVAQFLMESHDEDLLRIAGQILKSQYPKGPLYKPTMKPAEKTKTIEFWTNWAKSQEEK